MGAPIADLPPPGSGVFVGPGGVGAGGCSGASLGFSGTITIPIPCLPITLSLSFLFKFNFGFSLAFILQLPSFLLKFLLNCSGFNIAAGVTLPAVGGRISACVPDLDDFELAA
jgi:hypothetical protein